MKILVILGVLLVLGGAARGQEGGGILACSPVEALNNPGDVIHADFCVTNFGYHDETFSMHSSGGESFYNWSGPDDHCFHGQANANTFNETVWAYWGGDGAGWQAYCAITQVDRIGGGRRMAVRPSHKDDMHTIGAGISMTADFIQGASGLCTWKGCVLTINAIGIGARHLGDQMQKIDPFDPLYGTPYYASIPEPSDLGLDWDWSGDGNADATNYYLWRVVRFVAYGEAANVNINRASSCPDSNTDCIDMHTDLAQYYLRTLGETAYDAAGFLDQLGDNFAGYWDPDIGGDALSNQVHFLASEMRGAYGTLSQINY